MATTVVEVGVDVPNATIMLIEHADRFGLSQLHQLRGRKGGEQEVLLPADGGGAVAGKFPHERLNTMVATTDGFRIAETDLKLRGPGDFFGTRQWGFRRFESPIFCATRNSGMGQARSGGVYFEPRLAGRVGGVRHVSAHRVAAPLWTGERGVIG